MVLDRDYPFSSLQLKILAVSFAACIAFGFALFGGFIPGLRPSPSGPLETSIDGRPYYLEVVPISVPWFANSSAPWNVTFHNVTFELRATHWYSGGGGWIVGNGTERNGSRSTFALGGYGQNGTRATLYLSPDRVFAVSWVGGVFAGATLQVMVEVAYSPVTVSPPLAIGLPLFGSSP
jgi:hypothetical protein